MSHDASRVRRYFERVPVAFDHIYDAGRGSPVAALERWRHRSMFERYRLTLECCGDVQGKRVLDVGCGSGRYAVGLARRGAAVTGVDFSGPMIELAVRAAQESGVTGRCRFLQGDIRQLVLGEAFDVTLAIGFFDYTSDTEAILSRLFGMTRQLLIASFPSREHWLVWARRIRLGLAGCPVYFYRRAEVARLLRWPSGRLTVHALGRDYLAAMTYSSEPLTRAGG